MHKQKMIAVTAIIILFTLLTACSTAESDYRIFENISECEKIEANMAENATITQYQTPDADKNLKNLSYDAFFAAQYESPDMSFTIFAYEFANSEAAKQYFKNSTGKTSKTDVNFSCAAGLFSSEERGVFIDGNNAYTVLSAPKHSDDVYDYLAQCFSLNLDEEYAKYLTETVE